MSRRDRSREWNHEEFESSRRINKRRTWFLLRTNSNLYVIGSNWRLTSIKIIERCYIYSLDFMYTVWSASLFRRHRCWQRLKDKQFLLSTKRDTVSTIRCYLDSRQNAKVTQVPRFRQTKFVLRDEARRSGKLSVSIQRRRVAARVSACGHARFQAGSEWNWNGKTDTTSFFLPLCSSLSLALVYRVAQSTWLFPSLFHIISPSLLLSLLFVTLSLSLSLFYSRPFRSVSVPR